MRCVVSLKHYPPVNSENVVTKKLHTMFMMLLREKAKYYKISDYSYKYLILRAKK